MQIERRPFTDAERRALAALAEGRWFALRLVGAAVLVLGTAIAIALLIMVSFFPGYAYLMPYLVAAAYGAALAAVLRAYRQARGARQEQMSALRADLRGGEAEIRRFDVRDALALRGSGGGPAGFFLQVDKDKVLFMAGRRLAVLSRRREFPRTGIELVRAPLTKRRLDMKCSGGYLKPLADIGPLPAEQPKDGTLYSLDFENLKDRRKLGAVKWDEAVLLS